MYECGHRDGMLVQLAPGKIIALGLVLKNVFKDDPITFEIYARTGDWRNYHCEDFAEELHISPLEAELWLMEVAELESALSGQGNLPFNEVQRLITSLYEWELGSHFALKDRLESAKQGFARVIPFLENLDDEPMSFKVFLAEQFNVLEDTKRLCRAAIETGNPIELLW